MAIDGAVSFLLITMCFYIDSKALIVLRVFENESDTESDSSSATEYTLASSDNEYLE